ncbi:MAG: FHA domain-containing protein [Proteobacteria bacterium]|nr:FHA domain-containing protein [Pseudomonadota bacterium]MBU1736696.1 FHA domain-containing protein [Pseudomonadota bacterium]
MLKEKPVHRFIVYVGKPMVIGRTEEADVTLDNPSISREHAVVEVDKKGCAYITDKGSTNGTIVNGRKITERTLITEKDEIKVGKFTMVDGSVGILDVEKQGRVIPAGDDKLTMYVPPAEEASADKKKKSSGLGGMIKGIFKK